MSDCCLRPGGRGLRKNEPAQPLFAGADDFAAAANRTCARPPGRLWRCRCALGDSSTVELRTLTPSILVRIQVPQPVSMPVEILLFFNKFYTLRQAQLPHTLPQMLPH